MADTIEKRLAAVREKRGYLLAHHGLLCLAGDDAIRAYDALYTQFTLAEKTLTAFEKEFVWLGLLAAHHEPLATHHVQKFLDAGGTEQAVQRALALTSIVTGRHLYEFGQEAWSQRLPNADFAEAYLAQFGAVARSTTEAHLLAVGVSATTGQQASLTAHLRAAYDDSIDEQKLLEALLLAMLPGGVPTLANAAETWRRLIAADELPASPAFKHWANIAGQQGFG